MLSKTSYRYSRGVSIMENVHVRDVLVQQTPAPLGTGAWTLPSQTIPIVLSHKTWGTFTAPLSPGATLRTTDYLLRRQHTTTASSSTKATLTKPAPLQNKSAECKCSLSHASNTPQITHFNFWCKAINMNLLKNSSWNAPVFFAFPYSAFPIPLQKIGSWFSWQIIT